MSIDERDLEISWDAYFLNTELRTERAAFDGGYKAGRRSMLMEAAKVAEQPDDCREIATQLTMDLVESGDVHHEDAFPIIDYAISRLSELGYLGTPDRESIDLVQLRNRFDRYEKEVWPRKSWKDFAISEVKNLLSKIEGDE